MFIHFEQFIQIVPDYYRGGMFRSKRFFVNGKSAMVERFGFGILAMLIQEPCQIVLLACYIRMF